MCTNDRRAAGRTLEGCQNFEDTMAEGNLVRLAEADVAFHEVIYKSSDNRRLNQVLNNLREQIYRYRVEYLKDEETRNLLVKEHEEIYGRIRTAILRKHRRSLISILKIRERRSSDLSERKTRIADLLYSRLR